MKPLTFLGLICSVYHDLLTGDPQLKKKMYIYFLALVVKNNYTDAYF